MRRSARLAAAVLVTGLALSGCASAGADAEPQLPVVPASAGHLHGIGVNPADGKLYLGTHAGTMVVDGDEVRRVGTATIDLMGFAIAGPDHFLASGHPGAGSDLPNPVGLIESTDGGRTWTALSLAGKSDFHALTASGGVVYGFDGVVKSTTDGRSWTPGATDVFPASFAVDPTVPTTVLATTQHGPVRSTDGGATFTHVDGAPLLVFLTWTSPGALWGVDTEGDVHHSEDGGATWQARGNAGGPPEAFTATDPETVVVALANEIVRSTDGGTTFTRIADKG